MLDMTACSRGIGWVAVLVGLLLTFSGVACNGPTGPTLDDLVGIYTGRWRGNINGWAVTLDVQATKARPADGRVVGLRGTGTALNSAGESHRLAVGGLTVGGSWTEIDFRTPEEFGPGPGGLRIVGGNQHFGSFNGSVSGRTWGGSWTPTTFIDGTPILGPASPSVTLIKE